MHRSGKRGTAKRAGYQSDLEVVVVTALKPLSRSRQSSAKWDLEIQRISPIAAMPTKVPQEEGSEMTATREPQALGERNEEANVVRKTWSVGRLRWAMLALVFAATALNYIDRAALGILQPILSVSLGWTTMDYANINFWFQAGYAVGYFLQGSLIDRLGVRRVFFWAVLLWSLATGAHAFTTSVAGFMLCRLILGLTEGANYPSGVKISRLWFPPAERAIATGIFNGGTHIGAILTPIILPALLFAFGWQAVFIGVAILGLAWALVWARCYYDPKDHPWISASEREYVKSDDEKPAIKVPLHRILVMRGTWAFALAFSLTAPVFWFYLYWLPPYLHQQYSLGISVNQIGLPLIIIYVAADVGSIGGGLISSFLITRGVRPVYARLITMFLAAVLVTSVVAANSNNLWTAVLAIALGLAAGQAWITNIYNICMDYTPKELVSTVFGFGGMCAAGTGMFMTQVVGYVLTTTHNNYKILFMGIPGLYAIALIWLLLLAPKTSAE
ncbi:major facilitator superfamily MFS_1 [Paraburkholderia phymatum STM815]|uniref:Major facilitator superfamily MFS_1 n=2 Tax=Paraburkholderia phymatum TaxID=148447 RepID=B2JSF8_PARP8|nr:major facilitator superfamily MFS_1 [Paraburkholderia phymatum STM815]